MTTVAEMRRRFAKVDLVDLTGDAMEERSEDIVDYNKQQLDEGIDSKDRRITPSYTRFTIQEKIRKGQEYRFVTLQDTNEFRSKFYLKLVSSDFEITSSDSKTEALKSKYGQDIFGLTKHSKEDAWSFDLSPIVVRKIKNITGAI